MFHLRREDPLRQLGPRRSDRHQPEHAAPPDRLPGWLPGTWSPSSLNGPERASPGILL